MDNDFLHDLFADFGVIDIKRMFSGRGLYAGGVIFAIVTRDGAIHFKTDAATRAAYEQEGSKPLTFTKKSGQHMVTSYWRLPERLYDEPEELARWAREAARVAQAVDDGKKKPEASRRRRVKSATHEPTAEARKKKSAKRLKVKRRG